MTQPLRTSGMKLVVKMPIILLLVCCIAACQSNRPLEDSADHTTLAVKRIALSFDDGPRGDGPMFSGDERATVLIEALSVSSFEPAVFFVTTNNLRRDGGRERIKRYAQAGHLIANHTHTHAWLSRTDTQTYIEDIALAESKLQGFGNRRPWFRFPYLDEGRPREKRDAVRNALNDMELINGFVTVDNYDWYLEQKWQEAVDAGHSVNLEALGQVYVDMLMDAVDFYQALAERSLGQSPAHVLLLHENDVSALFVDDLIATLTQQGWDIISPDEAYSDPLAKVLPTTLRTRQGHVAALAIEAGVDPRTLTHLAIEETQIDELLRDRQVFGR